MAHAFAVKAYGGQVHEVGITLLCLTPVPFVDASGSGAFADKRERVAGGAGGVAGRGGGGRRGGGGGAGRCGADAVAGAAAGAAARPRVRGGRGGRLVDFAR